MLAAQGRSASGISELAHRYDFFEMQIHPHFRKPTIAPQPVIAPRTVTRRNAKTAGEFTFPWFAL